MTTTTPTSDTTPVVSGTARLAAGERLTVTIGQQIFSEVISYYVDPEKCQACMICMRKCPAGAVSGGKNLIHI